MAEWPSGVSLRSGRVLGSATLGYVAAYLLAAWWAVEFSIDDSVLIWFPPAGVAIGLLFFGGWRLYPAAVGAEVLSTQWITDYADEFGPFWLVVNSVVIAGAYLAGAEVMRALRLDPALRHRRDLLAFAAGALVVGPLLASLVGVGAQIGADLVAWEDAWESIGVFLVGDEVGVLGVTPTLLVVGAAVAAREPLPLSDRHEPDWAVMVELLLPCVIAVGLLDVGQEPLQFLYLVFVPVVVVAMRHGVVGAALCTAGLTAVLTVGADLQATGTLERADFQTLLGVVVLTGLAIGVAVSERTDLLEHHRHLSEIVEATPDLVGTARADGTISYLNPIGVRMLGLPDGDAPPQVADFFADDLSRELLQQGIRTADRTGTWYGTNTVRAVDGRLVPVSQVIVAHGGDGEERRYSTVCRDITDQRRLEEQLRRSAVRDGATGLANRALLVEQLGRLLRAPRRTRFIAVLHVDIDRFRLVNESLGYQVGDRVVAELADRLQAAVRDEDLVARYSGALFAVVLPDIEDELELSVAADRILSVFTDPIDVAEPPLVMTGSIGGVLVPPGEHDAHDALRRAEIALHRAKEAGGGRLALFDSAMDERAQRRLELEADLRHVIETGEWWLAYQPIIDATTRRIVSCEALLRWTHPERGPVPPFQLIVLAEHTGEIVPLGRQIFHRACTEAQVWHDQGFDLRVAINVSRGQVQAPGFVTDVAAVLAETGIDPARVVLEITETVLAADTEAIATALHQLRQFGCHIAMDDFGTGYSSLSSLRDLPIDVLKLDRSFITDLPGSERAAAAVEAVVRLADRLDLLVVAEGVEEEEQLEALCRLGCDRIQGYAVARPMPANEVEALLVRQR